MGAVDVKWAGDEAEEPHATEPALNAENSDSPAETTPAAESTPVADKPAPAVQQAHPVVTGPGHNPMARSILEVVLGLLVIGLALWVWTLSADKHDLQRQLQAAQTNPQALVQKQSNELIAKVGKLMNLPAGETPTVANVTDASAAKQQSAFFNQAQNGDKVLLYAKAGEAILYRPGTNKIILVAPLTFNNAQATTPATGNTTTKH